MNYLIVRSESDFPTSKSCALFSDAIFNKKHVYNYATQVQLHTILRCLGNVVSFTCRSVLRY